MHTSNTIFCMQSVNKNACWWCTEHVTHTAVMSNDVFLLQKWNGCACWHEWGKSQDRISHTSLRGPKHFCFLPAPKEWGGSINADCLGVPWTGLRNTGLRHKTVAVNHRYEGKWQKSPSVRATIPLLFNDTFRSYISLLCTGHGRDILLPHGIQRRLTVFMPTGSSA